MPDWTAEASSSGIEIIGCDGCSRTQQLRTYRDARGVSYNYRDVDKDFMAELMVTTLVKSRRSSGLLPIMLVKGKFESLEGSPAENAMLLERVCRG